MCPTHAPAGLCHTHCSPLVVEKGPQYCHVFLTLIDVRKMRCVINGNPLGLLDVVEEGLHCNILSFILRTIYQKRRDLDLFQ
jgi:hypothetical protein